MQGVVYAKGTIQSVLTSSDNTISLEAGYYDSITISTELTSLSGTITYTHHQCSNTTADLTYTDVLTDTSGAASVSETTINGKTVAAVKGGCYTTPYYYYGCTHSKGFTVVDLGNEGIALRNHRYKSTCNECGATKTYGAIGHEWDSITQADELSAIYKAQAKAGEGMTHPSGYTYDSSTSNIIKTYYEKSCGYTNGQLLSATITY